MFIDLENAPIYLNNKIFPWGLGYTGNDTTDSSANESKLENRERRFKMKHIIL